MATLLGHAHMTAISFSVIFSMPGYCATRAQKRCIRKEIRVLFGCFDSSKVSSVDGDWTLSRTVG